MINSINNAYNRIMSLEKQSNKLTSDITSKEKEEKNTKCDVIEISKECLQQLQNQKDSSVSTIDEETTLENATQQTEEFKSADESEKPEESPESTSAGTSMGINAGKLARKLAAAKTREQVQAVMQEIRQDIDECEAGKAQGATVDESSLKAAQNLLSQASQKMSQVSNRQTTPEENMTFLMAGLM